MAKLTEEKLTDRYVAEHPSRSVKQLHSIANTLAGMEDDLEGYLSADLIGQLTEARHAIEATRDSILFMD